MAVYLFLAPRKSEQKQERGMSVLNLAISIIGVIVGCTICLHIYSITGLDPMGFYIALTIALAIGCAWITTIKKPNLKRTNGENK